jgi:hypothetical protein
MGMHQVPPLRSDSGAGEGDREAVEGAAACTI